MGEPRRVAAVSTLGDFFSTFGVQPFIGSVYRPADSNNGHDHVVVLSYAFWQELTGGDPGVIGRTVRLDDASYEVVGVLGPEFRYHARRSSTCRYRSRPICSRRIAVARSAHGVARLRSGVTAERVRRQLGLEAGRCISNGGTTSTRSKSDTRLPCTLRAVPRG